MRKLLIIGLSCLALSLGGAAFAQSSGGGGQGGNQGQGGQGGSTGTEARTNDGQPPGQGSDTTSTDRRECPPGRTGVNCQEPPAQ